MASFSDSKSGRWDLRVTLGTIIRVKEKTGKDLRDLARERQPLLRELADDPATLFSVLCSALEPELASRNLSSDAFLELFVNEEHVVAALHALVEATCDFLPPEKGKLIKEAYGKVIAKQKRLDREAVERAERLIGSPDFDKRIEALLSEKLGLTNA